MATASRDAALVRAAKLRAVITSRLQGGEMLTTAEIAEYPAVKEFGYPLDKIYTHLSRMVQSGALAFAPKRPDGRRAFCLPGVAEPQPREGQRPRWSKAELKKLAAEGRRLMDAGEATTIVDTLKLAQRILPKDRQRADLTGGLAAFRRYLAKAPTKRIVSNGASNGANGHAPPVDVQPIHKNGVNHAALAAALLPLVVNEIARLLVDELRAMAPK